MTTASARDAWRAARRALEEDLSGYGDVTGGAFAGEGSARIVAHEGGVLSGSEAFMATARQVSTDLHVRFAYEDGMPFVSGAAIATVEGPVAAMLAAERTGLNFLGRLSGVATLTSRYVAETSGTGARIAATRKTTPGLRALEKRAVVHGGGTPHRFGLFDGILIKDNHVAVAGGVKAAIALVRSQAPHVYAIEVEIDTLEQLDEALAAGATAVLLDNMSTSQVQKAVALIAGRVLVEVSGGVRLERVRELAATGVDIISVGALTTRSAWIDMGLDVGR